MPQHPPEARQRAAVQGEQVPATLQPQDLPGNHSTVMGVQYVKSKHNFINLNKLTKLFTANYYLLIIRPTL